MGLAIMEGYTQTVATTADIDIGGPSRVRLLP